MNMYKQIIKALHEAKTGPISDMDEIVKQYSKSANYKRNLDKIESLISEAEKIYKKIEKIAKETDYFKEDSEYKKLVDVTLSKSIVIVSPGLIKFISPVSILFHNLLYSGISGDSTLCIVTKYFGLCPLR